MLKCNCLTEHSTFVFIKEFPMKVAIYGYGNLGRGVESAIAANKDMELVAVFSRRDPASLTIATPSAKVVHASEIPAWKGKIDVIFLCGGFIHKIALRCSIFAGDIIQISWNQFLAQKE